MGLSPMALTPTPPPLLGRWDSASSPLLQNHTLKLQVPKRHFGPPAQHHTMRCMVLGPPETCTAARAGPLGLSPMALRPTPPPLLGPRENRTRKQQVPRQHLGPPAVTHSTKCMVLGSRGSGTAAPGVPLGLSPKAVPKPDTRFHNMKCKISENLGTRSLIHNRRPNVLNCKKP